MRSRSFPAFSVEKVRPWGFTAALTLLGALASPFLSRAAPPRPPQLDSPEGLLWQFDSLMASPTPEKARACVIGEALRMFDLLLLSNQKVMPMVDTARSHDTLLAKEQRGGRAALKVKGTLVFKQPFMGMDSLASVQVMHCLRTAQGWKLAAFAELDRPEAEIQALSPEDSARLVAPQPVAGQNPGVANPNAADGFFPSSSRMLPPSLDREAATEMRMRLRLRQPQTIPGWLAGGGNQKHVRARNSGESEIQITRQSLSQLLPLLPSHIPDSLSAYLSNTEYIQYRDSSLLALANRLAKGLEAKRAKNHASFALEYTQAVYAYLQTHFTFQLGATLFGTSRESLLRMRGDCSECAVLTAALLRAKGIPSRLAIGFASVGGGAFIGHAWCEAWLGDWVGVDASLREFPAGVQRARLMVHDGSGDVRVAATNLVLKVVNNLDIEMLSAKQGVKAITLVPSNPDVEAGRRFFEQVLSGKNP
jgi:Transglutaminase-like superfamily